jgi:hypothetical protein
MMNRAAVASTLFLAVSATAYAEDAPTVTNAATVTANAATVSANAASVTAGTATVTAGSVVVVSPNVQGAGAPAAVAPALAPPGAAEVPPTPPGPPQNEDWNNVSHINGHPVPVGERGTYLYAFKKTNISTNPIGWMFGYYQIAGEHAVSQNVALSLQLTAWDTNSGNHTGYEISASAPIFFRRAYSGPFLEPGIVIHNDNTSYDAYACSGCSSSSGNNWVGPEMMLGWSWIFDSGLNMSFAAGAAKKMGQDSMSYSSDEPEFAGYFRVGYAF